MNIRRWDFEQQNFVEDAYPETMFKPFLDWLLTTQAWIEDPAQVVRKVNMLRRDMLAHRTDQVPVNEPNPVDREAEIQAKRLVNLAKAREARKAKRELAHA